MSLGLSALTLLDQRLELAIGVHAANNVLAVLAVLFSSADIAQPSLFLDTVQVPFPWWEPASAGAQFVVVYFIARWILHRGERHRFAALPSGR